MAQKDAAEDEAQTAEVSEDKFNGTATLNINVPAGTDKDTVKLVAEQYFRDTHGTSPSRIVAEEDGARGVFAEEDHWIVMVADHSSGSLAGGEEYEL